MPGGHILRLDLRSLALARIAYGAIIFLDTLTRWSDIEVFYSDRGILPRMFFLEWGPEHWFSVHFLTGSVIGLSLLFGLQALAALALLLGWHTRLATVLLWVFLISLHNRNPLLLNGGDTYLRVMLFWMIFLPTGHSWSWDAKQGRPDHFRWMPSIKSGNVYGMCALAVLIQISCVYWFAALAKTDISWTATFTATNQVLHIDQFVTPMGRYFREAFSHELPLLTYLVTNWEFWGPFLLFFPFDKGQTRTIAIFGFVVMHLSFDMMLELGYFGWICALTPLILIPTWFWDSPLRRFSNLADQRLGKGPDIEGDRRFQKPREALLLLLLLYSFTHNMQNEKQSPKWLHTPTWLEWFGYPFRLDQRWNMFSPGPLSEDGWYVVEGRFHDGPPLDLHNASAVNWQKPKNIAETYKNQRWRKYLMNLWLYENAKYRQAYAEYVCREWKKNIHNQQGLFEFDIVYMLERTNADGSEQAPEKQVIFRHKCPED